MGAFQSGFSMGQAAYQQAQDNKQRELDNERRRIADERVAKEDQYRDEERARVKGIQTRVDGLNEQLTRPNAANYSLASAGPSGPRMQPQENAATADAVEPAEVLGLGLSNARQPGLSMDAQSQPGMKAALQAPAGGYTAKETPTRGAAEDILAQIALAKDDHSAYRAAMTAKRRYDFDDGIANHTKAFQAMKPEDKTALMEKFTADQGIPLNMVPSTGTGKDGKPTYATWVEGKPKIQLNEDEVGQLYAASQLMGSHPDLARAQLERGSDKVKSLFKQYVELTDKQMDTNNQAVYHGAVVDKAVARDAASGPNQISREERLKYTSLFSEAGRRVSEAQKAMATLQADKSFMRKAAVPDSPQAQQLEELKANIKSHNDERSTYQGLLAGSQAGPSLANVAPATPGYQNEAAMRGAASGDMGANPAAIQREIAATAESLKTVTDPNSRVQLQAHLDDLKRQGQAPGLASVQPKVAAAGKPNYSNLWK